MTFIAQDTLLDEDDTEHVPIPWRKTVHVHKFCNLLPPMTPAELRLLADDIRAHGLKEKIKLLEVPDRRPEAKVDTAYVLVDGRNRLDAFALLGERPWDSIAEGLQCDEEFFEVIPLVDDSDIAEYIARVNLCRRSLPDEHRSELTAQLLAAQPTATDRKIAEATKVTAKTVMRIRQMLEDAGDHGELPGKRSAGWICRSRSPASRCAGLRRGRASDRPSGRRTSMW